MATPSVNYGATPAAPTPEPSRTGYTFSGWSPSLGPITGPTTYTAQYTINTYTVTFKDWNGTVLNTQSVTYGSGATTPSNPVRVGFVFVGWDTSFANITSDLTVNATFKSSSSSTYASPHRSILPLEYSYSYIFGYQNGNVGNQDFINRECVCATLYRILKQSGKTKGYVKPTVSDYTDITPDRWSYASIEYMKSIGALLLSSQVNPTQPVTRGEMAKLIAKSVGLSGVTGAQVFSDLMLSNPNYSYIQVLVHYNLLTGYSDKTIKPDANITRAEYIAVINRLIGRDNRYDISGKQTLYKDLDSTNWAYNDIQRASFSYKPMPNQSGTYLIDPASKLNLSIDN